MELKNVRADASGKEEEVSALDIIIVLLKHKWFILSFVAAAAVLTIAALYIPIHKDKNKQGVRELFYSECAIQPYAETYPFILTLFLRAESSLNVLKKTDIYGCLYPDSWDAANRTWKVYPPPSRQDTWKLLQPNLFLSSSDNIIALGFFSRDPELSRKIIQCYLTGLSEYLRQRDRGLLKLKKSMLERQLSASPERLIRSHLTNELIRLSYDEIRLKDPYYGFTVIEQPGHPQKMTEAQADQIKAQMKIPENIRHRVGGPVPPSPAKTISPGMILFLMTVIALTVAIFLSFFMEFLKKVQRADPEKLMLLRKHLHLRERS